MDASRDRADLRARRGPPAAAARDRGLDARLADGQAFAEVVADEAPLPAGVVAWLTTFLATALATLDPGTRTPVVDAIATTLEPSLRDDQGGWWADDVRLRVAATRV